MQIPIIGCEDNFETDTKISISIAKVARDDTTRPCLLLIYNRSAAAADEDGFVYIDTDWPRDDDLRPWP